MSDHPAASILPGAQHDPQVRAGLAARSVQEMFGTRALGLPGTWLGAVAFPHPGARRGHWHYWWQAHLLDALVDSAHREAASGGDPEPARRRAHQLLRGIAVRAGGSVALNAFYDDMAWLMIALGRLRDLDEACSAPERDVARAGRALLGRLRAARTPDLGGGMFWNRDHAYKNTATTGPGSVIAVRTGQPGVAAELLWWLREHLWDRERGVFWDGLRMPADGAGEHPPECDTTVYTYNSGPALGAVVELAQTLPDNQAAPWRAWAGQIVAGADAQFGIVQGPTSERRVLRTHGGGDSGLFTGILARYLAQAAVSPALDDDARAVARRLVLDTAEALWEGRREFDPGIDVQDPNARPDPRRLQVIFSTDPTQPADRTQRVGAPVELSGQVQAWTVLEAAARVARTVG